MYEGSSLFMKKIYNKMLCNKCKNIIIDLTNALKMLPRLPGRYNSYLIELNSFIERFMVNYSYNGLG